MTRDNYWKYNVGDTISDSKRQIRLIDKEERLYNYNSKMLVIS